MFDPWDKIPILLAKLPAPSLIELAPDLDWFIPASILSYPDANPCAPDIRASKFKACICSSVKFDFNADTTWFTDCA